MFILDAMEYYDDRVRHRLTGKSEGNVRPIPNMAGSCDQSVPHSIDLTPLIEDASLLCSFGTLLSVGEQKRVAT